MAMDVDAGPIGATAGDGGNRGDAFANNIRGENPRKRGVVEPSIWDGAKAVEVPAPLLLGLGGVAGSGNIESGSAAKANEGRSMSPRLEEEGQYGEGGVVPS
jgi:hypothetical protein